MIFLKLADTLVRTPDRWISPDDPFVVVRNVSGWEFELEPANDWLTVTLSARLSGPIGEKTQKNEPFFKFIFGSFRLVDTDDDLTRPVQTLINWVSSETGGMSAMVHMDADPSDL